MEGYVTELNTVSYCETPYSAEIQVSYHKHSVKGHVSFRVCGDPSLAKEDKWFSLPAELIILLGEKLSAIKQYEDLQNKA